MIKEHVPYSIICSNCKAELGSANFHRILELPSQNMDFGEWFCHKKVDFKNIFTPKCQDLFYGNFYMVLNRSVFTESRLIIKPKTIYCKRCLQNLGQTLQHDETVSFKIWNENILFLNQYTETGQHLILNSSLLDNAVLILKKIINDFDFVDENTRLLPKIHKIHLKTMTTSSSASLDFVHLLLQVMDTGLDVLKWDGDQEVKDGKMKLVKKIAMKVLFSFTTSSESDNKKLLDYWFNDDNVTSVEVSGNIFNALLDKLRANSEMIPEVYRRNCGFDLSYVFITD